MIQIIRVVITKSKILLLVGKFILQILCVLPVKSALADITSILSSEPSSSFSIPFPPHWSRWQRWLWGCEDSGYSWYAWAVVTGLVEVRKKVKKTLMRSFEWIWFWTFFARHTPCQKCLPRSSKGIEKVEIWHTWLHRSVGCSVSESPPWLREPDWRCPFLRDWPLRSYKYLLHPDMPFQTK